MNQSSPVLSSNPLKKTLQNHEESFIENAFQESSPKQENQAYSTLINRFIKFIVVIILMIGVWLGKAYGTPSISVNCLNDPIHNGLQSINELILNNKSVANFFQITSSLMMDMTFFSLFLYWVCHANSSRLIFATILFYIIRAFSQLLIQMRFPDGYYWGYPGFPSYVVPYGRTSDFFFSGHCGFLNICTLEWYKLEKKKMFLATLCINIYMAFVMLIFRVHYTIDIITGLIVSHYCYINICNYEDQINSAIKNLYNKSYNMYYSTKSIKKHSELEICEIV